MLVVLQVWIGDGQHAAGLLLAFEIGGIDGKKMRRIARGKWMKKNGIHQGEYGGGGADAEGERQDGEDGEEG